MQYGNDVFRCDYCGSLNPLPKAKVCWAEVDEFSDGTRVWIPRVYCSPFCVRNHDALSVSREE